MIEREKRDPTRKTIHWCKRCSRYHARQDYCDLTSVERVAKSGRKVRRLVHNA